MVRRGRRPRAAAVAGAASPTTQTLSLTTTTLPPSLQLAANAATITTRASAMTSNNTNNLNMVEAAVVTNGLMDNSGGGFFINQSQGVGAAAAAASHFYENHQHFASPKRKDCKVDKQLQVESYDGCLVSLAQQENDSYAFIKSSENSAPNGAINNNKILGKKTRGRGGGGAGGGSAGGNLSHEACKAVGVPLATRAQTRTIEIFFQNNNKNDSSTASNDKMTKSLGNLNNSPLQTATLYGNACEADEDEHQTDVLQTLALTNGGLSPVISIVDSEEDNSNGTEYSESTCAGANALLDFAGVNLTSYRDVSQASSFRSSTSDVENIFLQEPVLTLNVDKSPLQAACCVKINKSLDTEPIFSSPPSSLATAALNGRFSQIVSLNTSPLKQIKSLDFDLELNQNLNGFDYSKVMNGFTTTLSLPPSNNNNNNNLNLSNGFLEENNSQPQNISTTTPISKNLNNLGGGSGRKPTTPHRIVVCGSPLKTKSSASSITTSPSKRNASNKDDLINHQSPRKSQRHMLSQSQNDLQNSLMTANVGSSIVTRKGKAASPTTTNKTTTSTTTKTRRRLNQKGLDLYLNGNESSSSSSAASGSASALTLNSGESVSASASASQTTNPSDLEANAPAASKTSNARNSKANKTQQKSPENQPTMMNGFKPLNGFINGHITASDDEEQHQEDGEPHHQVPAHHHQHHQIQSPFNIKQKTFLQKLSSTAAAAATNPSAAHPPHSKKSQAKYKQQNSSQKTLKSKNHHPHHQDQNTQRSALTNNGGNREMTEFFPVRRRSERKTTNAVKEEMMRELEQAILEEREEGLKIGYFEGKGRGVIADRQFKRGEFVVEYIGDFISITEASEREKRYALDENAGCYMYYFKHKNQQYCIDATEDTGKLGRLVNHSRNGNLVTKVVVVKQKPHLVLVAKDNIQAGEELTYDYGDRSKLSLYHHPWLAY